MDPQDINLLRNTAFLLPSNCKAEAIALLEIALKYRPHGGRIRRRIDELRAELLQEVGSAPISFDRKLIVVPIPFAGSEIVTQSSLFSHDVSGIYRASEIYDKIGHTASSFRAIVIARNPWVRVYEAFRFLSLGGDKTKEHLALQERYVEKFDGSFKHFLNALGEAPDWFFECDLFAPGISFVRPSTHQNLLYVHQIEQDEALANLSDFIGQSEHLSFGQMTTSVINHDKVYDRSMFDIVSSVYIEDILEFGYNDYTLSDLSR